MHGSLGLHFRKINAPNTPPLANGAFLSSVSAGFLFQNVTDGPNNYYGVVSFLLKNNINVYFYPWQIWLLHL